jgi:hypothetical protein
VFQQIAGFCFTSRCRKVSPPTAKSIFLDGKAGLISTASDGKIFEVDVVSYRVSPG